MDNNMQRRILFATELLYELKKVSMGIKDCLSHVENHSNGFYRDLFKECKKEIQGETDLYKENIEKIKQLNLEITSKINEWYIFVKNPAELKKVVFPIMFYLKRRKLNQFIQKANDTISQLTIENRFITERLTNWEHELELKAIQLLKEEVNYQQYEELLKSKDAIIAELKVLLPTLPQVCPIEIEIDRIDLLIEKIAKIPAA
ncbi:MAG: hypothetical protein N2484_13085 [Clostridia bacterium]|nr:hypothetical protein [Clostridia bacterium]